MYSVYGYQEYLGVRLKRAGICWIGHDVGRFNDGVCFFATRGVLLRSGRKEKENGKKKENEMKKKVKI